MVHDGRGDADSGPGDAASDAEAKTCRGLDCGEAKGRRRGGKVQRRTRPIVPSHGKCSRCIAPNMGSPSAVVGYHPAQPQMYVVDAQNVHQLFFVLELLWIAPRVAPTKPSVDVILWIKYLLEPWKRGP